MLIRPLNSRRPPGRPRFRQRQDLRITIRFRYHCDQDLIQMLEGVSNKNDLIRKALRFWLAQAAETQTAPDIEAPFTGQLGLK